MLNVARDNQQTGAGFRKKPGSGVIIAWRRFVATVTREPKPSLQALNPRLKLMYKPWKPPVALLPHRVPAVRK
jgi:hypothetical protein